MRTRHSRPLACQDCPAYKWSIGFVPPEGPTDAQWAFLGQGPGEQEAVWGRPFYEKAPSGNKLSKWLARAGFIRSRVWIGNVVQCWLPKLPPQVRSRVPQGKWGNRDPDEREARHCWDHHVGPALHGLARLEHVVPIGAPATKWILQTPWSRGAERYVGTTTQHELPEVRASE